MKIFSFSTLFLLMSPAAFAEWAQEYCSNSEQTVVLSSGNDENLLQITMRDPSGDVKVILDQNDVNIRESTPTNLGYEASISCQHGDQFGKISIKETYSKEVLIANNDDSLFPETVVGLDKSHLYIHTVLTCERLSKSIIACDTQEPSDHTNLVP